VVSSGQNLGRGQLKCYEGEFWASNLAFGQVNLETLVLEALEQELEVFQVVLVVSGVNHQLFKGGQLHL
jgi:hypothetical protein